MKIVWTTLKFIVNFIRASYGVQMNFAWISYEMKSNLFIWIYMQFRWSSYELHIEGLMKLICYTHVILMKLTWGSLTVRMKYIWNSYEFRMILTSCEFHMNYMTTTQEVPIYYTWIWFLASLLCTSYEWASRSIVDCFGYITRVTISPPPSMLSNWLLDILSCVFSYIRTDDVVFCGKA